MPVIVYNGDFGGLSAGSNGLTAVATSVDSLPSNAVITGIMYSLRLTATKYSSSAKWALHTFNINEDGPSADYTAVAMDSASYTFVGCLKYTPEHVEFFKSDSIEVHCKANNTRSDSISYMREFAVAVTYEVVDAPTVFYRGMASASHNITTGNSKTFSLTSDVALPANADIVSAKLIISGLYSFSDSLPFDVLGDSGQVLGSRLVGDGSSADGNVCTYLTWDLDTTVSYESLYSVKLAGSNKSGSSSIMRILPGCSITVAVTYGSNTLYELDEDYPADVVVKRGESVELEVRVTKAGSPAATYQWYKDGVAIEGATSDKLVVSPTAKETYYCVLTNTAGSVQSRTAVVSLEGGCSISVGDTFVPTVPYIFVDGSWKSALPYVFNDGAWKPSSGS